MISIQVAALCAFVVASAATPPTAADRALVFKPGQTRVTVKGRITRENDRVCFSLRLRAGKHMKVRIVPKIKNGTTHYYFNIVLNYFRGYYPSRDESKIARGEKGADNGLFAACGCG